MNHTILILKILGLVLFTSVIIYIYTSLDKANDYIENINNYKHTEEYYTEDIIF
jgi:hypothetical protein